MVFVGEGGGDDEGSVLRGGVRPRDKAINVADRLRRVETGRQPGSVGELYTKCDCRLRAVNTCAWGP